MYIAPAFGSFSFGATPAAAPPAFGAQAAAAPAGFGATAGSAFGTSGEWWWEIVADHCCYMFML